MTGGSGQPEKCYLGLNQAIICPDTAAQTRTLKGRYVKVKRKSQCFFSSPRDLSDETLFLGIFFIIPRRGHEASLKSCHNETCGSTI